MVLKYHLYNSLFLTLNFDAIDQTGDLLPLLQKLCQTGLDQGKSPAVIIEEFFKAYRPNYTEEDKSAFLFNVIQYVERQIVLIDALEEAAYNHIHDINGPYSWEHAYRRAISQQKKKDLSNLLSEFGIRLVLTAHPTQFYPDSVLAIINDLNDAITKNDIPEVRDLLKQLGKTPFMNKSKPDPFYEASSLINYLTNVFYPAAGIILDVIGDRFQGALSKNRSFIKFGFWPGGDRDGNPFVTVDTTKKIAYKLRQAALECYYQDIKKLKRRLSFSGIYEKLSSLEEVLYSELTGVSKNYGFSADYFLAELKQIENKLIKEHRGLFIEKLLSLKRKVKIFGLFMASIDIRQDSRVIRQTMEEVIKNYPDIFPENLFQLPEKDQFKILFSAEGNIKSDCFTNHLIADTIDSIKAIKDIQNMNGEEGCHRYIISNCRGTVDIAIVYALFKICGWKEREITVDIVPLFESVNDLKNAHKTMNELYSEVNYKLHLQQRNNKQTVMLGFSDGTKDGGYLMANWSIYKAKEEITLISRKHDIKVFFFDGRGGPPARGGGSTHEFYSALGRNIESRQIQVTVQGQTINSHFGTIESAKHNLENLITAGLENNLFYNTDIELNPEQRDLIQEMAEFSYKTYLDFRNHPLFMPYLNQKSTLKYYGKANIGSRPVKRNSGLDFVFEDLRAIPFVGAWSQLKQNIPGFYGLGSSLKNQEAKGNFDNCIDLYAKSVFFRTLISNSMQSMSKTYFPLTYYLRNDEKFGDFWNIIYNEYELSCRMIRKLTGSRNFLSDNPRSRMSIKLREEVVLPLLTIQQFALSKIEDLQMHDPENEMIDIYEKMTTRTLFGNINASRNSA